MRFVGKVKTLESTYEKIGSIYIDMGYSSDVLRILVPEGTIFEVFGKSISVLSKEEWITKVYEIKSSIPFGKTIRTFHNPVIEESPEHKAAQARHSEWRKVLAKEKEEKKEKKEAKELASLARYYSGLWEGAFICGNVSTGLTLEIATNSNNFSPSSMRTHQPDDEPMSLDQVAAIIALPTPSEGSSRTAETAFENRFIHMSEMQRMSAIFNFYPIPQNPNAKSGSFSLKGWFSMDGSFVLEPNSWIEQPADYRMMVGMSGRLSNIKTLAGSITTRDCSTFNLQKQ